MFGKIAKNSVSGYSKTVVSHCRGCIFQGFQSLQKVRKTTPEFDSKQPQNLLKSCSEGSPKHSWNCDGKYRTLDEKRSPKWGLKNIFDIFCTFLRSGSKDVPGWSQGPSQGLSSVKIAPKWVSKWLQNHQQMLSGGFLKTLLKDTRTNHVSK